HASSLTASPRTGWGCSGSSVWLLLRGSPQPEEEFNWASSSRSQVRRRTTCASACLSCEVSSAGVCWRPPLATAIVTQLVTLFHVQVEPGSDQSEPDVVWDYPWWSETSG